MNQTLKPDRPIWPPVPETNEPPGTGASEAMPAKRDPADDPPPETAAKRGGGDRSGGDVVLRGARGA